MILLQRMTLLPQRIKRIRFVIFTLRRVVNILKIKLNVIIYIRSFVTNGPKKVHVKIQRSVNNITIPNFVTLLRMVFFARRKDADITISPLRRIQKKFLMSNSFFNSRIYFYNNNWQPGLYNVKCGNELAICQQIIYGMSVLSLTIQVFETGQTSYLYSSWRKTNKKKAPK